MDKFLCWFCGSEMIWMVDLSFEDKELLGDGVVSSFVCSNEECNASCEFSRENK